MQLKKPEIMKRAFRSFIPGLLFCLVILIAEKSFAQDTITKLNSEQIVANIIDMGEDEIKFKYYTIPDGPVVIISKKEVKKINGAESMRKAKQ